MGMISINNSLAIKVFVAVFQIYYKLVMLWPQATDKCHCISQSIEVILEKGKYNLL